MKKMIFIALVVVALTAVARADLISYWTFDEGKGTIAHDSVGGNHGLLFNGPAWTLGKFGDALRFDGIDDCVLLPNFSVNTNNGTIALWFKTSGDFSGNYGNMGFLISGNDAFWNYLALEGGGNTPYRISGETNTQDDYFVATDADFAGPWNHIAVSFYNKTAKTYLNGWLIDTMSVTDSLLTIGRIGGMFDVCYNGRIDDVRIYDRALSRSEIIALVVPEPATLLLLGLGGLALLQKRRK